MNFPKLNISKSNGSKQRLPKQSLPKPEGGLPAASGTSKASGAAKGLAGLLAATLTLAACNGPWNMDPDEGPRDPKLWVSMLLVADRPLDTLWVERPLRLDRKADPAAPFVDAEASALAIIDPEAGDTLRFRPVPGRAAAWVAEDAAYRVQRGTRYLLQAQVRWNASREFPSGAVWKTEILTAETKVPADYALDSVVQVPVDALHPSLSVGLPSAVVAQARADASRRRALYDSLDALPGAPSLASRGVDEEAFAGYLEGRTVYRPLGREDTLHFIFDAARARMPTGDVLMRYSLPFFFTQKVDKRDFGGLILSQRFDSTRARIIDPMIKGVMDSHGMEIDSVSQYQRGAVRPVSVQAAYTSGMGGFPDTLRVANMQWGYTGRNVLYAYSVDPDYYQYYKGLIGSGAEGGGGLGGGSSRPQNVLRYSNVANGEGYFAGAVADSFAVHIRAAQDTIPVSVLREAWLRDQAD